jgi:rare lipoprotein A
MRVSRWLLGLTVLALAACSSSPSRQAGGTTGGSSNPVGTGGTLVGSRDGCPEGSPYAAAAEDPNTRGNYTAGGLYRPGVRDTTPDYIPNVACIPEPVVTREPRSAVGNRTPYTVLGRQYHVLEDNKAGKYEETGIASYYGAKFHGRLTSNREVYDMYTFSAAHKSLPLPSFAEVTNVENGQSVVVRVNDRGPFHEGRVIDLSYAAAVKLGITQRGTGQVRVRALTPGQERSRSSRRQAATSTAAPAAVAVGSATTSALAAPAPQVVSTPLPATHVAQAVAGAAPGAALLQVASFASRDNAERALQQLLQAGIAGGRLQDVIADGRTLWRLRVAADDPAGVPQLVQRIAALGLGQPRVVTD